MWSRIWDIICPCCKSEKQYFLEEIIVEESCEVLREVVVQQ